MFPWCLLLYYRTFRFFIIYILDTFLFLLWFNWFNNRFCCLIFGVDLNHNFIKFIDKIFYCLLFKWLSIIILFPIHYELYLLFYFLLFKDLLQVDIECITFVDKVIKVGIFTFYQKLNKSSAWLCWVNCHDFYLPIIFSQNFFNCFVEINSFLHIFPVNDDNLLDSNLRIKVFLNLILL